MAQKLHTPNACRKKIAVLTTTYSLVLFSAIAFRPARGKNLLLTSGGLITQLMSINTQLRSLKPPLVSRGFIVALALAQTQGLPGTFLCKGDRVLIKDQHKEPIDYAAIFLFFIIFGVGIVNAYQIGHLRGAAPSGNLSKVSQPSLLWLLCVETFIWWDEGWLTLDNFFVTITPEEIKAAGRIWFFTSAFRLVSTIAPRETRGNPE